MSAKPEVVIYTDGSCLGNPGAGGWGAVVITDKTNVKKLSGGAAKTTNNRMELMGIISALNTLAEPHNVTIYSDSQYVVKAFTESWLKDWKRNGWSRKDGELKNRDLWKLLDILASKHNIVWNWVRGHAGNKYNEICDKLAVNAAQKFADEGDAAGAAFYIDRDKPDESDATVPNGLEAQVSLFRNNQGAEESPAPVEDFDDFEPEGLEGPEGPGMGTSCPTPLVGTMKYVSLALSSLEKFIENASEEHTGLRFPCGGNDWCACCESMAPDGNKPSCAMAYIDYISSGSME